MPTIEATRLFSVMALALACMVSTGCGRKAPAAKVVYGAVTCGGEKVSQGKITFTPIEGNPAPNCVASIVDGRYRIDARGGVYVGKYRVLVDARKKTGRQVMKLDPIVHEKVKTDETVRMGPENYVGEHSPLVVEVRSGADGRIDIAIPK
jgi:hypothetical protein